MAKPKTADLSIDRQNAARTRDLLDLSHVPRWTTHPVSRPQSVAEHSFRTAVLAMRLAELCEPDSEVGLVYYPSFEGELLKWALLHDGPEVKTGDFPAPVKAFLTKEAVTDLENWACSWYESARPIDNSPVSIFVHLADMIESITWVSRYGQALRDRFDEENIESKLRIRLARDAEEAEVRIPGVIDAVHQLVREVCP